MSKIPSTGVNTVTARYSDKVVEGADKKHQALSDPWLYANTEAAISDAS